MVRLIGRPDMTIAVYRGRKGTKTNNKLLLKRSKNFDPSYETDLDVWNCLRRERERERERERGGTP